MSTTIQSNKTLAFWEMVREVLNANQYENLSFLTGLPTRRLAFMEKTTHGVGTMTADEIKIFATLLKMDIGDLIMDYGCGTGKLTLDDANEIARSLGYSVGMIAHVA